MADNEPIGMCFVCGRRLRDGVGRVVPGVTRDHHGAQVRMHKACAKDYDTERAATTTIYPPDWKGERA